MPVTTLRWGIIGTGRIAREFAAALAHARHARLVAVASRTPITNPPAEFAGARLLHGYATLLADSAVDAVYIATPHPTHASWAIRAAEAGKHILCEKPLGMNAAEAEAVIAAARQHDVFLMEAFMYRTHPQTQALLDLLRAGAIGDIRLIQASFGYHKPFDPQSRQYNKALGGGGILDVGCYPVSFARLVAGAAIGQPVAEPLKLSATGQIGPTGIDEWATATLEFPAGVVAQIGTGVALAQDNTARIFGTKGWIDIRSPWFGGGKQGGTGRIRLHDAAGKITETIVETPDWLYAIEADTVARDIARRQASPPAPDWADTLGNMRCLDAWRAAIGLTYDADRAAPAPAPMPTTPLARLPRPISRLVLGTAGLTSQPQADTLFDAFLAAGGTAFDTAHEYGDGLSDTLLGTWMQSRNIRDQVTVIGKGAHSPDCFPATVTRQLHESLERLRTDRLDIYFLHRDNPAVPVGEFVDVLNEHHRAGRIGLFGGSNWTLRRMDEANAYAARHGLQGFHVLSNQFSLADMLKPVWAGCLSASDAKSIAWLKRTGIALFAWSSQARGFFTDRAGRNITTDRDLVRCWYNRRNFARRDRAAELARQRGTTAAAVALAYNLAQDFPLFSLIGPLTPDELQGSLAALRTPLTAAEAAWLKG